MKSDILTVTKCLKVIKEFTGIEFQLCDYFTSRLSKKDQQKCFDVILSKPMWLSEEYILLERFAKKYKSIKVECAGYKRVQITIL